MTLDSLIRKAVAEFSDRTFIVDKELYRRKEFGYNEIFKRANSLCGFFRKKGIKKGDKIIIYLPNSSDYASLLWACALSGAIAVPLDFNSNPDFVSLIYKKAKAKLVFCSVFKSPEKCIKCHLEEMSEIYEKFREFHASEKIYENGIFEIVYTSGTTAEPKGVIITHRNLKANIESMKKVIDFPMQKVVFLSILPLSHLFEQTIGFFLPIFSGSRIVYSSSRTSSFIIKAINEEKISAIVSVPLFLSSVKNKIEFIAKEKGKKEKLKNALRKFENYPKYIRKILFADIRRNLGNLKYLVVGGAPLDAEVERFWRALGFNILQGYGLTESSPVLTCNNLHYNKIGTVGKVISGVEIKIQDGEILAKGDNIFPGYYEDTEETEKTLKNGWLYTGDIGEFDSDGFLRITGRKKNIIISPSGLNVYPEDIEKVLNNLKGVKDSVVFGIDNGKKIIGVVLADEKISLDNMLKETNAKLSSHQYLSKIYKWNEKDFPRTPTLKVIRRKVEEGIKIGKIMEKESSDKLIQLISGICEVSPKKIRDNARLINLGLDSLKRIDLAVKIEEAYNIDFNEDNIGEKTTVNDIRNLIISARGFISESGITWLNSKAIMPVRFLLQHILFALIRPFISLKIEGKENIPDEPAVYIANHCSQFDTLAVIKSLPIKQRIKLYTAGAKDYFFEGKLRLIGPLFRLFFNTFAFSRTTNIKQGLKDFGEIINRGGNVLIFPEGTRSITGKLQPFKSGIGLIVWNMNTPVIPIKITGLYEILPKGSHFPKPGNVKVKIGKAARFSRMQSFQEITNKLEKEFIKL